MSTKRAVVALAMLLGLVIPNAMAKGHGKHHCTAGMSYECEVRCAVKKAWEAPKSSKDTSVKVAFSIKKDVAAPTDVQIKKSSGDYMADQAALDAVEKAKLPAFPASMDKDQVDIVMHLGCPAECEKGRKHHICHHKKASG